MSEWWCSQCYKKTTMMGHDCKTARGPENWAMRERDAVIEENRKLKEQLSRISKTTRK